MKTPPVVPLGGVVLKIDDKLSIRCYNPYYNLKSNRKGGANMSELVPALKDTLFSPTCEIIAEYAEIGIDALLDNEVLKGIPVVGTLSSLCKVGYNLHERNLIRQTLAFITEFNSGSISQEKLDEHREKLEANPKEAEKELG